MIPGEQSAAVGPQEQGESGREQGGGGGGGGSSIPLVPIPEGEVATGPPSPESHPPVSPPQASPVPVDLEGFFGGRVFLPAHPAYDQEIKHCRYPRLRVLSYNVLADCNVFVALNYCLPQAAVWERRKNVLINEIRSYDAHIVCLQDVDNYEWWQQELNDASYDSVYKRRTSVLKKSSEGVVIAWKRECMQCFRLQHLELNDAVKEEPELRLLKSLGDDVATMVLLQPRDGFLPCPLCIANTQFGEEIHHNVHILQARYIARKIEEFNAVFQAPLILCGSLTTAGGVVYEALTTGRRVGKAGTPRTPMKPIIELHSRTSLVVKWQAVPGSSDENGHELPVMGYWVAWRPGGNTNVGFTLKKYCPDDTCLPSCYPMLKDATLLKNLRMQVITGLNSNTAYEFRLAAVNGCGLSPWSLCSEPVETMRVSYGSPPRHALGLQELKAREEHEAAQAAKAAEEYIQMKMATLEVAGPHKYATHTGSLPQYTNGQPNLLVAPVRKHMIQYFPSHRTISGETEVDPLQGPVLDPISRVDDTPLDGLRDDFYENSLRLCSAYATSCLAGEPSYTYLAEDAIDTRDFIFHSAETFVPCRLLSMPSMEELEGFNPSAVLLTPDPIFNHKPFDPSSSKSEDAVPHYRLNARSSMILLPNLRFPSNHLAIMAELALLYPYASSNWRSILSQRQREDTNPDPISKSHVEIKR